MGYAIGTITKSGGDDAYLKYIDAIKTLAEANGWTTLRYTSSSTSRELIMKSLGLSGTEEIYVGFKSYFNVTTDYYNISIASFDGYVSAADFFLQPNAKASAFPAHNLALTHFTTANAQRILLCVKVESVYEHAYVGKYLPYARPGEFPYPTCVYGMLDTGTTATRYSDTTIVFPWWGARNVEHQGWIRMLNGTWNKTIYNWPFSNGTSTSNALYASATALVVPHNGIYTIDPLILLDGSNVYGEVDGVYAISGFSNGSENVLQIGGSSTVNQTGMTVLQAVDAIKAVGGRAFVVAQDHNRTALNSYVALEMK